MRFIIMSFIIALIFTGCSTYSEMEQAWKENKTDFLRLPLSQHQEKSTLDKKEFAQEFQKRLSEIDPSGQMTTSEIYDFETEKAKQMRSLAKEEKIFQAIESTVSLELLICLAYERNPELQSLRKKWQAARERYSQAELLYDTLDSYTSFTKTLDLLTSMKASPMAAKTVFPDSMAFMSQIINTEIEMAHLEYIMGLRDLIYQICQDYFELLFLKEAISIHKEHIEILRSLETLSQSKFQAGMAAYSDVLKAQIAREETQLDLETEIRKKNTIKIRLLSSLHIAPSHSLGEVSDFSIPKLTLSPEELYTSAKEKRQEIKNIQLMIQKQEQMISLARSQLYPTFTLGLSALENKSQDGMDTEMSAFPETPMYELRPWSGKQASYIQEMKIEKEALQNQYQQLLASSISQIQDIYFEWDTARRSWGLLESTLLPISRESMKVTQIAYQTSGEKSDFLNVLDAQNTLVSLRLKLEENKKNYIQKLSELEKITGMSIFRIVQKSI